MISLEQLTTALGTTLEEAIEIVTNAVQTGKLTVERDRALAVVQKAVEKLVAADVAPEKRGKWITVDGVSRCSECGYIPAYDSAIDDIYYSPYCPNCGAKMDGEE